MANKMSTNENNNNLINGNEWEAKETTDLAGTSVSSTWRSREKRRKANISLAEHAEKRQWKRLQLNIYKNDKQIIQSSQHCIVFSLQKW